jgi:hypothetical protein
LSVLKSDFAKLPDIIKKARDFKENKEKPLEMATKEKSSNDDENKPVQLSLF